MRTMSFLRRRFAWFCCSLTPHEQEIPSRLSGYVLALALTLPVSAVLTETWHKPLFFPHLTVLMLFCLGDLHAFASFGLGMETGRRELCLEIVEAWHSQRIAPGEYVYREIRWEPEEITAARKTVRRSVRGWHGSSGRSSRSR